MLFKNDNNSLFIRKSVNTPTNDQENELDNFDHNTDDETSENEYGSTSTEESISNSTTDSVSVLSERLDTLQNFFLSEISDIKVEIKNNCNQKISKEITTGHEEKTELLQNQIIYITEEFNSKNQLINLILENVFKSDIPKVTSHTNSNTLLTPNDDYQFPKRFSKNHHQKCFCDSYTHDNRNKHPFNSLKQYS